MAFGFDPAQEPAYRYFTRLYTEAFRRLGYRFAYEVYPLARCTVLAEEGAVDGEPQRIWAYQEEHPQLLRVDASVLTNRTLVYGKVNPRVFQNWDDLKTEPGTLVYLTGAVHTQKTLADLGQPERLLAVGTAAQGLELVRTGRATFFIDIEARTSAVLFSPRFSGSGLKVLGVLETAGSYPYLNRKHADLVAPLAATLATLRKEGTAARILKEELPWLMTD